MGDSMSSAEQLMILKIQLEKLKYYENIDFRDLKPSSANWLEFWQLYPQKQEEMLAWQNGKIIVVGDITEDEQKRLIDRVVEQRQPPIKSGILLITYILHIAEIDSPDYSFIYCDLPETIIQALNWVLSYSKVSVRVIGKE